MTEDGPRLRRPLQKDPSLGRASTSFSFEPKKEKSVSSRERSPLFALVIVPLVLTIISVGIIFIGAEVERVEIDKHRVQLELYTHDDRVCAGDSTTNVFETYPSASEVPNESSVIAHCGGCGVCSNMHDMGIYAGTTQTLTDSATLCSFMGYVQSFCLWRGMAVYRRIVEECLAREVGFTPSCQDCWLDDMVCSIQKCAFTCFKILYILKEPKNKPDGSLNKCLECDEKVCGPDFLKCSGANRRRQGIQSDITREDEKELCRVVQMDWKTQE